MCIHALAPVPHQYLQQLTDGDSIWYNTNTANNELTFVILDLQMKKLGTKQFSGWPKITHPGSGRARTGDQPREPRPHYMIH